MTPFLLVIVVALAEAPTWRGYRARVRRSADDGSTALVITLATVVSVVGALFAGGPALPAALSMAGIAATLLGAALRCWAIVSLGRHFTLTLQAEATQPLVERGPYRWVRHPSYLGAQLGLLGVGLATGTVLSALLAWAPLFAAHLWRIEKEEQLLARVLGARWRQYAERTWRLVPGLV
jgi:protein-S-isoprenylcysteine O-methyltransferase Ste14